MTFDEAIIELEGMRDRIDPLIEAIRKTKEKAEAAGINNFRVIFGEDVNIPKRVGIVDFCLPGDNNSILIQGTDDMDPDVREGHDVPLE